MPPFVTQLTALPLEYLQQRDPAAANRKLGRLLYAAYTRADNNDESREYAGYYWNGDVIVHAFDCGTWIDVPDAEIKNALLQLAPRDRS